MNLEKTAREFEKKINLNFNDINLLINALTHSSFANESGGKNPCNERLEFLGDSVFGVRQALRVRQGDSN